MHRHNGTDYIHANDCPHCWREASDIQSATIDRLRAQLDAERAGCSRSHPHENMTAACRERSRWAKAENELFHVREQLAAEREKTGAITQQAQDITRLLRNSQTRAQKAERALCEYARREHWMGFGDDGLRTIWVARVDGDNGPDGWSLAESTLAGTQEPTDWKARALDAESMLRDVGDEHMRLQADYEKAERERDSLQFAVPFAIGAIEDAIYLEDGLDGDTGERVIHVLREALENGTFDAVEYGKMPRPHADITLDAVHVALGLDPADESDVVGALKEHERERDEARAELARVRDALTEVDAVLRNDRFANRITNALRIIDDARHSDALGEG